MYIWYIKPPVMKKILTPAIVLILLAFAVSCDNVGSYYEQFSKDKGFTSRINDINKPIDEIRSNEKGKLILDDIDLLKYVYKIGNNDTYQITYLFDEKGCYEIGVDGYFELEVDANNVVDGIKKEMATAEYSSGTEDNNLCRWKNANETISIELDYKDTSRGLFIATIFANE